MCILPEFYSPKDKTFTPMTQRQAHSGDKDDVEEILDYDIDNYRFGSFVEKEVKLN